MTALSRAQLLVLLAILLAVGISYAPSIGNDFTNWDDNFYVTENDAIRDLTLERISGMFTSSFKGMYSPLVLLSFAVEHRLVGDRPLLYHADNLALHLGNTLLVFVLVLLLCSDFRVSAATALLFGVHPLHVESVAWVSERKDLLYALFFLAALVCYIRYRQTGRRPYHRLSLLLFVLSMLSKPQGIFFPCVLVAYDYAHDPRFSLGTLSRTLPHFFVSAVFFLVNAEGLARGAVLPPDGLAFVAKSREFAYAFLWYPAKLIAPFDLSCVYPPPNRVDGWERALYLWSPALVIALPLLAARLARHARKVIFASLFVVINLAVPVVLSPAQHSPVYDRYSYLPSIGVLYLLCEAAAWAYRKGSRLPAPARVAVPLAVILAAGACSALTWQRCRVWENSLTLWSDVIGKHPDIAIAPFNLGIALMHLERYDEAARHLADAARLAPDFDRAHLNLGIVLERLGSTDQALSRYRLALRVNPRLTSARINLGNALAGLGMIEEAIVEYREVLRTDPREASVHYNLGFALATLGNSAEATDQFRETLRLEPDHELARLSLELLGVPADQAAE